MPRAPRPRLRVRTMDDSDPSHDGLGLSMSMNLARVGDKHATNGIAAGTAWTPEDDGDLRDFFDNAAIALHWVGRDGTILRANQAELDLLGYAEGEYVGHNITEFHADAHVIADLLARLAN